MLRGFRWLDDYLLKGNRRTPRRIEGNITLGNKADDGVVSHVHIVRLLFLRFVA